MSELFVWRSRDLGPDEAQERFARSLADQTAFSGALLSTRPTFRSTRCGDVHIGQISSNLGIRAEQWQPWQEVGEVGVAWAGVCEDHLGVNPDHRALGRFASDVLQRPERLVDLNGAFSVCAWDRREGSAAIATGATQPQTLWEVSGPHGYAIGSRAGPLLDLVGRRREFDADEASTFLAYGYLLGEGCLYRHVRRVRARQQVLLAPTEAPRRRVYVSIGEYLGEPEGLTVQDAVRRCADVVTQRIATQVRASEDPVLHLTGGRDSRCIAAALARTGFHGRSLTGGAPTHPDVMLAARVSKVLGFTHSNPPGVAPVELLQRLARHRDRARLWTRISEGVETIRHGLHQREFFEHSAPYPPEVAPAFNGHHPGLETLGIDAFTPDYVNTHLGPHLTRHAAVTERFEDMRRSIDTELREIGAPASRWPELHYWQNRALQWGQDVQLVKDLFAWNWTPLFDRTLLRTTWFLPDEHRGTSRFMRSVTAELVPALEDVPYQGEGRDRPLPTRALSFGRRKARTLLARTGLRAADPAATETQLWREVLFGGDAQWQELISPDFLADPAARKQHGEVAWSVATVQLFMESDLHP